MNQKDNFEYTLKHCRTNVCCDSFANKVVIVKIDALEKECGYPEYQFQYVAFHKPPSVFGHLIRCFTLYSGVESYFKPDDIVGIVLQKYIPTWGFESLKKIIVTLEKDEISD